MIQRRNIATIGVGSRRSRYMLKLESLDYSQGYNSQSANDVVPQNQLVHATDTRVSTLGRQTTRRGCDFYTVPAGEGTGASQASTTGAADKSIGLTSYQADKFVAGSTKRLTMVGIRSKNAAAATGPIIVEIHDDVGGSPGELLATSSIPSSVPTSSYAYLTCRFIEAPLLTSGATYWIVAYIQDNGTRDYSWSSTTAATTAKTSSNGASWSATSYGLNFQTYLAPDGALLGHIRATKSDGTTKTILAYKEAAGTTAVAVVSDVDGSLTTIKTGLSASATRYSFWAVNDVVGYANGYDVVGKWDYSTWSVWGGSPVVAAEGVIHVNALFVRSATDPTRVSFSAPADFETWPSTNFLYVPTPKSADWIVRMVPFNNQNLVFLTKRTKWVLAGSDISVMRLNRSIGIKGCVGADTVQQTLSYIYFASDDGAYRWNGSSDELLTAPITNEYQAATNQSNWGSVLSKSRYYLFFTPPGEGVNSRCWVMNIMYKSVESVDLATYIRDGAIWDGPTDDGRMVQASNLVAALYFAEVASNNFSNLGRPLSWEIRTRYEHYNSPSQVKDVPFWYPRFHAEGAYNVIVSYDVEMADSPTDMALSLDAGGFILGSPTPLLGDFILGGNQLINPELSIGPTAAYIQRRYRRTGVETPVEYYGDTTDYFVILL